MVAAGKVVFVSAGPGAADLITLRGARFLAQADVVLADALADPALRELAPDARWIDVGKRGFEHSAKQTEINALLVKAAREHALVVRLKGGDASIFGRLEEELLALAEAGIDCEVVPGVTAALAAAAQARRPLTRRGRGRSVSLTTAMTEAGELRAARSADTEVFYMAGRQLAALGRQLLAAGWAPDTPTLVVSRAGCADAITSEHALADLARAALLHRGRPTVVTVGTGAGLVADQSQALSAPHKIAVSPEIPPMKAPLTAKSCP
ncbi:MULTISPECIES: uroporphyrinogen-III C-methyltransferase [Roseateles]|uniref:uroporphyrinogen-III C-methyltransferase n=1 Tax=Pelomonas caseinilytica TaxID=2906763 RepID=A0ABS8XBV5_9BURK|nr:MULTISPECIES: uroporphyrinogen-III C-methyltransferase [unclassified Roseateles]MCE4535799.1 uroporphyrinogen-III C-methyltransferase [Pelomonas sp. P7]HEV6967398.1 uroporphyrinogen-III C-methyltransferase [Roseateles sp.]